MKEAALWLLVVVIAGCSGTKSNSGPPFLDGLAVSKESPIEVKCRGDIGRFSVLGQGSVPGYVRGHEGCAGERQGVRTWQWPCV
jgi:hypothetical protein